MGQMSWEDLQRLVAVVSVSFLVCYFRIGRMVKIGLISGKRAPSSFQSWLQSSRWQHVLGGCFVKHCKHKISLPVALLWPGLFSMSLWCSAVPSMARGYQVSMHPVCQSASPQCMLGKTPDEAKHELGEEAAASSLKADGGLGLHTWPTEKDAGYPHLSRLWRKPSGAKSSWS